MGGSKHRNLTDLTDDEFYFLVRHGINEINANNQYNEFKELQCDQIIDKMKQNGINGSKFKATFTKKNFEALMMASCLSHGAMTKLFSFIKRCNIEQILLKMNKSKDDSLCVPIKCNHASNEWQNINAMQLRYALQFILLQTNKNKKQSQKQINIDAVIL